jgi:hypothetical protein
LKSIAVPVEEKGVRHFGKESTVQKKIKKLKKKEKVDVQSLFLDFLHHWHVQDTFMSMKHG